MILWPAISLSFQDGCSHKIPMTSLLPKRCWIADSRPAFKWGSFEMTTTLPFSTYIWALNAPVKKIHLGVSKDFAFADFLFLFQRPLPIES